MDGNQAKGGGTAVSNWSWDHLLPFDVWSSLSTAAFAGWDKVDGVPHSITLYHEHGTTMSSREVAIEWDDVCRGQFYYGDQTKTGTPFVRDGDTYKSQFWFQFVEEAQRFRECYFGKV